MIDEGEPRRIPFRAMIPNAITTLALCFGLTGVGFAISATKSGDLTDWQKAKPKKKTLLETLRSCPVDLSELDLTRSKELPRDIAL